MSKLKGATILSQIVPSKTQLRGLLVATVNDNDVSILCHLFKIDLIRPNATGNMWDALLKVDVMDRFVAIVANQRTQTTQTSSGVNERHKLVRFFWSLQLVDVIAKQSNAFTHITVDATKHWGIFTFLIFLHELPKGGYITAFPP